MTKKENYELILQQVTGLLEMEQDKIASLGNVSAVLKEAFPESIFNGFYLYQNEQLVLGPFQGSVSCTRIPLGKGVCGESALKNKTLIVPDVRKHQNYIACDSRAISEIVVPMYQKEQLLGVLDLDAKVPDYYDEVDEKYLKELVKLLVSKIEWK